MSIFREHKSSADRSAADRKRHKAKIDKAIREGIKDVIADESIIGQDGNKKVKIPVKGIKEYQFVYGENDKNQKAGAAGDKQIKRGQVLRKKKGKSKGKPEKASDKAGEEYYEVEVTLDELAEYLFSDLELPEKKKFKLSKIRNPSVLGTARRVCALNFLKKKPLKERYVVKNAPLRRVLGTPKMERDFRSTKTT